jgi:hypothetical protein
MKSMNPFYYVQNCSVGILHIDPAIVLFYYVQNCSVGILHIDPAIVLFYYVQNCSVGILHIDPAIVQSIKFMLSFIFVIVCGFF